MQKGAHPWGYTRGILRDERVRVNVDNPALLRDLSLLCVNSVSFRQV